ncbi:MAG TPA: sigma-70 family RNA polymerase sigma factor [Longimicrobiales bacterium]
MQGPSIEPSDGAVVTRVMAGDRDAYRILVQRYQDGLYRHALRMTSHADVAADLVQGALVKAYTHLHRCRDPERFGAWLFRILANRCKDHLKSRRRRDVSLDAESAPPARSPEDPELDAERLELRHHLQAALERLPDIQREAFLLKHVEGLSYEEISEMLDVSVPALKMRVLRAREALRAVLEEVL